MSVSRGCQIIESAPNKWWCVVARDEYDYDFLDGEKFGPAETADEAFETMRRHSSNPGCSTTTSFEFVSEDDRELLRRIPTHRSYR